MIEGTTPSGFEFSIDENLMKDYRLLDMLIDIEDGNFNSSIRAVKFLLGNDQKNKLCDFCKDENGYVPVDKVMDVFGEVMNSVKELKNL